MVSYVFAFCGAQVTNNMTWGQDDLFKLTCKFILAKYKFYIYFYIINIYINIKFIKSTLSTVYIIHTNYGNESTLFYILCDFLVFTRSLNDESIVEL